LRAHELERELLRLDEQRKLVVAQAHEHEREREQAPHELPASPRTAPTAAADAADGAAPAPRAAASPHEKLLNSWLRLAQQERHALERARYFFRAQETDLEAQRRSLQLEFSQLRIRGAHSEDSSIVRSLRSVLDAQAERLQQGAAELRAQQGWASSAAELLESVHRAARAARQAQQHSDPDPAPLARFAALHAQFASLKAAPSIKSVGGDGSGGGLQRRDLDLESATTDTENDSLSSNNNNGRHLRRRRYHRQHHYHHHRDELHESQREAPAVPPQLLSYVVPPPYQVGVFPLGVPPPRVLYVDNMGNVVGSAENMRRSGLFETNKHAVANGFSREEEPMGSDELPRRGALDVSFAAKSLVGDAERRAASWEHQRALTQHSAWLLQFGKEMTQRSAPPELLPSNPAKLRVKKRHHRRHGDL
jgi:hypothetical protein